MRSMFKVPEDTKDVKVGSLIALMVGEGEDWKDVQIPGSAPAAATPAASAAPAPSAATAAPASGHGHSDVWVLSRH